MRTVNKLSCLSLGVLSLVCLPSAALSQSTQSIADEPRTQNSGALNTPQQSKQPAAQNPSATDTATASAITRRDQRYFWDLARANQTEILASHMAEARASSPDVKKFAKHMVSDHTTTTGKLNALAQKKQVVLPMEPAEDQQKMLDKLNALSGTEFDQAYIKEAGVKAHEDTLALLKKIQKSGHDADLKMLAEEIQPTVEAHLKMVKGMADKK
jgi:putative membrane protein